MFGKKDTWYQQQLEIQDKKLTELRRIEREHKDLEAFIAWLNELCLKEQGQLCGLRKVSYGESNIPCYIGFIMTESLSLSLEHTHKYKITGYLSLDLVRPRPAYTAYVTQWASEIPVGLHLTLSLGDNYLEYDELKRKGVGSAGLSIVKELAKHLHCSKITGTMRTIPNTPEERAKLRAFYEVNGFDVDESSSLIVYDMSNYPK